VPIRESGNRAYKPRKYAGGTFQGDGHQGDAQSELPIEAALVKHERKPPIFPPRAGGRRARYPLPEPGKIFARFAERGI
jgi:hypothetical protein